MRALTEAEHEALLADRALLNPTDAAGVRMLAEALVLRAEAAGCVVAIDQRPLQPFAMGHYESVVSVRQARSKA